MNRSLFATHRRTRPPRLAGPGLLKPLLLGLLAVTSVAHALTPQETRTSKLMQSFNAPELDVHPSLESTTSLSANMVQHASAATFLKSNPGSWEMRWDTRGDRPNMIQGSGIALVPGRGNSLTMSSLGFAAHEQTDLAVVEARLLDFMKANGDLLKTDGLEFQLDTKHSMAFGEGNTHWNIQFQQIKNGVPVKSANLFFRISNGNIIQFGSTKVGNVVVDTQAASSADNALGIAWTELAFPKGTNITQMVQPGELQLLPYAPDTAGAGEEYRGAAGQGYSHRLAWRFVFRVNGDITTYQVLVDAKTNRVIEVRDLNEYVNATVDGGVFPIDQPNTVAEVIQPMPFASVTNGGAKITDALGIYDYSSGSASVTLNGKYIQIVDTCGSISLSNSSGGDLHLGTSTGTDCGTAGTGGAGNTRSSRNAFRYLTNINRKAASFFPNNAWLNGKVTANVNLNQVCNAYWDGSALNFFKKGTSGTTGCANTGELPAVFLHEFGHGIQQNVGGAPDEMGTGEATGDTFAMLETKSACIGVGFFTTTNGCHNCSAACTGVRDINQFSSHGPASFIVKPSNITTAGGPDCNAYKSQVDGKSCPYLAKTTLGTGVAYQGPMGYEGHCESYIASSANWDLAQSLVTQYGATQGWAKMDALWYQSLPDNTAAYQVAAGGKCNTAATVNGCASNNWYNLYLAADDDDGNLANGTPNACRIWDAFNAHGIACGARPACSGGTPTNVPPVANFGSSTNGLTATFTDSSTDSDGTIASRAWTFGDGGTSTVANPSHTYAAAGTYTVTLKVTDNGGATNTKTASVTVTATTSNVPPVANFSVSTSGLVATFTDSSTDSDGTIASRSWTFGDGGTSTVTSPSHTYAAAGTYSVVLTVTDNAGATNAKTSSVTVTASTGGATGLQNGVAVTGLSAATGTDKLFTLVVPAGATGLKFVTTGGTGDADMYVKFNGTPTTTVNDCKSEGSTTAETCSIATAQAGTYTVLLHSYATYSGVSLTGSYSTGGIGGSVLQSGVPVTGVSAALNAYSTTYTIVVPAGKTSLQVKTTAGGTGDGDLYVRLGSAPTTSSYTCVSGSSSTSNESCTISFPTAGTYYIRVYGYSATSNVTLQATYSP